MAITDDDLDACFSTADFGVIADFGGSVGSVTGHFTGASDPVKLFGGEIEAADPSFACKSTDIAAVAIKASVTIDGVVYTVQKKQKIGTGVTLLILKT